MSVFMTEYDINRTLENTSYITEKDSRINVYYLPNGYVRQENNLLFTIIKGENYDDNLIFIKSVEKGNDKYTVCGPATIKDNGKDEIDDYKSMYVKIRFLPIKVREVI